MTRTICSLGVSAALLSVVACDPQAVPGFQGETLVRLAGITSSEDPIPDGLSAAVSWVDFLSSNPRRSLTSAGSFLGTGSQFPSRFKLEIFTEPGDLANDFTAGGALARESRIGLAEMEAAGDDLHEPDGSHWYAYSHQVLVHVEERVQPGTASEKFLGGTLDAGFRRPPSRSGSTSGWRHRAPSSSPPARPTRTPRSPSCSRDRSSPITSSPGCSAPRTIAATAA